MHDDILLLDTSSSMAWPAGPGSGSLKRIEVLQQVLDSIRREFPTARVFAFNSACMEIEPRGHLPVPQGGTALDHALQQISYLSPKRIGVLCDGEPNNPPAALEAAKTLQTEIHTFFCGDETDSRAVAFMRALAWCSADGIGKARVIDLEDPQALLEGMRLLLTHSNGGPTQC